MLYTLSFDSYLAAAAASVSKPLPNDAAGKKPNSWEAVDMGGTSEVS